MDRSIKDLVTEKSIKCECLDQVYGILPLWWLLDVESGDVALYHRVLLPFIHAILYFVILCGRVSNCSGFLGLVSGNCGARRPDGMATAAKSPLSQPSRLTTRV